MSRASVQDRIAALRTARVPFVHAQVVRAERPTSAKPGDEAVVFADGTIEGFVGGSCAESTVRAQSLALLDSGEPLLLRIRPEPSVPAQGGTGSPAQDEREHDEPGVLAVHNPCLSGGALDIFLEPQVPAPLLVVAGDSPIAQALAQLGPLVGWHVQTAEGPDVPDGTTAVVVASHGRDEEPVLTAALRAGTPYVGLVASRKRGEAVVASLEVDEPARARVRTPAGLDIGARTPEEVALSVLAELVSVRQHPSGRPVVQEGPEAESPAEAPGTAVDPVCGMSVATVEASLHLDHGGRRWWFCGSGCLRAFAADPDAYSREAGSESHDHTDLHPHGAP
ncbi:MAG: XdhC family protein [Motilibacteraceae bacterium]